jgi:hypothetical protein
MENDGDRQEKMEGYCSTGQSSQRAVEQMEEEELDDVDKLHRFWRPTSAERITNALSLYPTFTWRAGRTF